MDIKTKKKLLFDGCQPEDKSSIGIKKTQVIVTNHDTGEVIFKGQNKVIFPGAEFTAQCHFDLDIDLVAPSYSEIMRLDTDAALTSKDIEGAKQKAYLFCVGTDGCGPEASQKYPVDFTKPMLSSDLVNDPTLGYMIPFRFMNQNNPLDRDATFRNKYFGRRLETIGNTGGSWIAYYFKKFEHDPILTRQYIDGTTITPDSDIYHSTKTDEAQCFVQLKLTITNEDCRDFFALTTGANSAKWNSLSICTATPATYTVGELKFPYYKNITPLTKLHINNASLIDTAMQYDINYQLYY